MPLAFIIVNHIGITILCKKKKKEEEAKPCFQKRNFVLKNLRDNVICKDIFEWLTAFFLFNAEN